MYKTKEDNDNNIPKIIFNVLLLLKDGTIYFEVALRNKMIIKFNLAEIE
jgi:hypothetical protein